VTNQDQARVLDALGDASRRAVLELVRTRERPVVEIARRLPISRPAVSQHLRILKEAGLVRDRRVGNRRLYGVDARGLAVLRSYLERYWDTALAAFARTADQEKGGRS
jgi:DNA-binding transcriptional ArsR family regulator